jgi:hypothetical protein
MNSLKMRTDTSAAPLAGKGTMMRTGLLGKAACAAAMSGMGSKLAPNACRVWRRVSLWVMKCLLVVVVKIL